MELKSRTGLRIAIICALPREATAVTAQLDGFAMTMARRRFELGAGSINTNHSR